MPVRRAWTDLFAKPSPFRRFWFSAQYTKALLAMEYAALKRNPSAALAFTRASTSSARIRHVAAEPSGEDRHSRYSTVACPRSMSAQAAVTLPMSTPRLSMRHATASPCNATSGAASTPLARQCSRMSPRVVTINAAILSVSAVCPSDVFRISSPNSSFVMSA